LEIQNRSTAVLNDVVLVNQSERSAIFAGDIRPCSALKLYLVDVADGYGHPDQTWMAEMAIFRDPVDTWVKDQHELRPLTDQEVGYLVALAHGLRDLAPMLVRLRGDGIVTNMLHVPLNALASEPTGNCGDG